MASSPPRMSRSPTLLTASNITQPIKISSLLNDNMQVQSSNKIAMPPSGLPTPDSTPVQENISDSLAFSSQDCATSGPIDPAVLPAMVSHEAAQALTLFPGGSAESSHHEASPFSPSRKLMRPAQLQIIGPRPEAAQRHQRHFSAPSFRGRSSHDLEVAFSQLDPAEVWYRLHVSDKAGIPRPDGIPFRSQLWTIASNAPDDYAHHLNQNSYDRTFASGTAAGLNWLSTVCENASRSLTTPSKGRPRAASDNASARKSVKVESRAASGRRPSIKKRARGDSGEPEAKRIRAAAVHKEKPNSYLEVPDYSPALTTFNSANVRAFVPKGGRIDLSKDPQIDLIGIELNQQERTFAEVNQLDINKYLINKRKIFQGRLQVHLQGKKSFTKTHAQQAAIIDVNKASRMWEFFEQAGWLDMKHFKKHIATEKASMLAKNMPVAKEFLN